jgi:type IV pilus assembly protein PilB
LPYPPAKPNVWVPEGCEACTKTGYRGRGGLFELLVVTEDIESAIIARKSSTDIRDVALTHGMKTLREDGWTKAFKGMTSVEEVMRVTEDAG